MIVLAELLGGRPIFKGKDYIDQLNIVLHFLGTPSDATLRRVGSTRVSSPHLHSLGVPGHCPRQCPPPCPRQCR
jgi:hypothetical protein